MSRDCFTFFSFLTPISLINLLLQQWVKEIVSLGFFPAGSNGRDHGNACPASCQGSGRVSTLRLAVRNGQKLLRLTLHTHCSPALGRTLCQSPELFRGQSGFARLKSLAEWGGLRGRLQTWGLPQLPSPPGGWKTAEPRSCGGTMPTAVRGGERPRYWAGAADPSFAPLWHAERLSIKGDQG